VLANPNKELGRKLRHLVGYFSLEYCTTLNARWGKIALNALKIFALP
jgi:hypothetical protein